MLVFGSDFLFGIHFGYFPKGYPTFDHGGLEPNHPSSDFFFWGQGSGWNFPAVGVI